MPCTLLKMAFTLQAFLLLLVCFGSIKSFGVVRRLFFFFFFLRVRDEVRANVCYSDGLMKVDYNDKNLQALFVTMEIAFHLDNKEKLLQNFHSFHIR